MTTLREAAQQALEALEKIHAHPNSFWDCSADITSLKAALAEPVQEPRTAWDDPRVQKVYDLLCDDAMPPNKQEHWEGWVARRIVDALAELTGKKGLQVEPVAYWHKRGQEDEQFIHAEAVNGDCPDCEPLYLAPQEHALEIRACECSAAKNGRCVMGDYGSLPIGTKLYAAEPCPCGDRPAAQCPGEWEPGCDLGNNPKHAKRVEMTPKELAASIKRGEKWKVAEPVQEPVAHKHEWFSTGAMEPGKMRCIHCGIWNQENAPPSKPLTEEEIDSIWDSEKAFADIYAIVRAIERAHGIT